jgi:hypothetical protein
MIVAIKEMIVAIKEITFHKRTAIHKLASALNLPKSTVHSIAIDNQRRDVIPPHMNTVVPKLTEDSVLRQPSTIELLIQNNFTLHLKLILIQLKTQGSH